MREPKKLIPHTCGHCGCTRETLNGAWLRWRRERAGVSLREMSRRIGVSPAFLSDVERCNRHATPRVEAGYLGLLDGRTTT